VRADSITLTLTAAGVTLEKDLSLKRWASVAGTLALRPDTALAAQSFTATLLPLLGGAPFSASVALVASPDSSARFSFLAERIPDGLYRLSAGGPGYGLATLPLITVSGGRRVDNLAVTLDQGGAALTFFLEDERGEIPGSVILRSPLRRTLSGGEELEDAPPGAYSVTAIPEDPSLLPLRQTTFSLSPETLDSTVTFPFPYRHDPEFAFIDDDFLEVLVESQAIADGGYVVYRWDGGLPDTLLMPTSQLRSGPGDWITPIPLRAQGGILRYQIVIRIGTTLYANDLDGGAFEVEMPPDEGLNRIALASGIDSLRLPAGETARLFLQGYDALGQKLDVASAQIRWTVASNAPFSIVSQKGSELILKADREGPGLTSAHKSSTTIPPSISAKSFAKSSANSSTLSTNATAWYPLTARMQWEGREKTITLALRVENRKIHRLQVSVAGVSGFALAKPGRVTLAAIGFDTTTTPPTRLVPNATFRIEPPEAGTLLGNELSLHEDFIGPLRIFAEQAQSSGLLRGEVNPQNNSVEAGLNVGQSLSPESPPRLFRHGKTVAWAVPEGITGNPGVLRLYRRSLAKTFSSLATEELATDVWEPTNPDGLIFPSHLEFRLYLNGNTSDTRLRRFDTRRLAWESPEDTLRQADSLGAYLAVLAEGDATEEWGSFAVFAASSSLDLLEFSALPNPFSPDLIARRDGNSLPGMRIRFRPSAQAGEITTTLKIYNTAGEPVRSLLEHRTLSKQEFEIYWDGKDDYGRVVRNGRYWLRIALTPTGGGKTRHLIKPLAVFR
jgi:hypothetical protein